VISKTASDLEGKDLSESIIVTNSCNFIILVVPFSPVGTPAVMIIKSPLPTFSVATAVATALFNKKVGNGDLIIITAGVPTGEKGTTNMMKLHLVGDEIAKGQGY
jgi:pyruvate kinase